MKKVNVKMVVAGTVLVGTLVTGVALSGRSIDSLKGYIYNSVSFGVAYASEYVKTEILGIDPEIEAENIRYGFETEETEDGYAEGYQFAVNEISVKDNQLVINGEHTYAEYHLGDVEVKEENGVVNIEAKIVKVEDFHGESSPLKVNKKFKNKITSVYLAGDIIYDQGTPITSSAASMYKYRLDSVSDVDATKKLVYGVTVGQREDFSVLDVEVVDKDIKVKMDVNEELFDNIKLEKDSPLILALAKDANSVTWIDEAGTEVYKLTVAEIGESIKQAGESAGALQKYIEDNDIEGFLSY